MVPSILAVVEKNRGHIDEIRVFEIGSVVVKGGAEQKHLCISVPSYRELAEIVRELFGAKFQIPGTTTNKSEQGASHPKNNALIMVDGVKVGHIAAALTDYECAFAEINLEKLIDFAPEAVFSNPSRFQKNKLDFTFETDKLYGAVEAIFNKFSHPLCMGFRLKDIFENRFTLQFTVGSHEKTLSAEDINDVWGKIIAFGRKEGLTLKE
jgi:phenylalanyl-tRNA synthetase beta subunit